MSLGYKSEDATMSSKELLTRFMCDKGWSKKQMADEFGVSRVQMHRYLKGDAVPSWNKMIKFFHEREYQVVVVDKNQFI